MSKQRRLTFDPRDPQSIAEALKLIQREVDGALSFGTPQDPADVTSTTSPGSSSTAHNGTLGNMEGAWAEATYTSLNSTATFYHNLNIPVLQDTNGDSLPNVAWLFTNYQHDKNGNTGTGVAWLFYDDAGAVSTDSIELTVTGTGLTPAAAHPLIVTCYFVPRVRSPALN